MSDKVTIISNDILSDNWYTLRKVTYNFTRRDGSVQKQIREAYDRGNGAAVLLYNTAQQTVILTRQFRLPTFINGNESGMMVETCAGLLDEDNPEACVIRETKEETGYIIASAKKVMESYMSPGAVTEKLFLFVAEYNSQMKASEGGGLQHEQEDIEVLEMAADEALKMIKTGEIQDAKTIMLLQYAKLEGLI